MKNSKAVLLCWTLYFATLWAAHMLLVQFMVSKSPTSLINRPARRKLSGEGFPPMNSDTSFPPIDRACTETELYGNVKTESFASIV